MKTLNLYRVWEIMNKLITKQNLLEIYISFFGDSSNYYPTMGFEDFLDYYNFSINEHYLVVFNDDGIPYEDYTNNDFSYIPRQLLNMSDEELDIWMEEEIKRQLLQQDLEKELKREHILEEIKRLQKELEK